MLLVLFGLPGTGKSSIGAVLQELHQFHCYDADLDIPQPMREALKSPDKPVTDEMRDEFSDIVIAKTQMLYQQHHDLVVAQLFLKEKHRQAFLNQFPEASFILLQSPPELRKKRIEERPEHMVDREVALTAYQRFDPPEIPHIPLDNSGSLEDIKAKVQVLLEGLHKKIE